MSPSVEDAVRRNQGSNQGDDRAIKIKTECLKLTLKGLQDMLEAEKRKLMEERGEVEGMAREKGLILLAPDTSQSQSAIFNTNWTKPAVSHIRSAGDMITLPSNNRGEEKVDWRRGDYAHKSFVDYNSAKGGPETDKDNIVCNECSKNEQLPTPTLNRYGTTGSNVRQNQPMDRHGDTGTECCMKQDLNVPFNWTFGDMQGFNPIGDHNSRFGQSVYSTHGLKPSFSDFTKDFQNPILYDTLKEKYQARSVPSSDQHLAALMSEVDHITKALEELESQ